MSRRSSPLPMLVGGVLIVAIVATLLVKEGWLIWIPVLLALMVVYRLSRMLGR
jgi:flagellar biosynthesis protein FliQ